MPGIYGGDDVSAVVLDIGTDSLRLGWAGQDSPTSIIKSAYGTVNVNLNQDNVKSKEKEQTSDQMEVVGGVQSSTSTSSSKVLLDTSIQSFRPNIEIHYPIQNSMLDSSNDPKLILPHILKAYSHLGANPKHHPLLITEPSWNQKEKREEIVAFAFDTLGVPACYLANGAVLSSFASGKPTSLLLDIGTSHSSAIPIVDGFILRKAMRTQLLGGEVVSKAMKYDLENVPVGSLRLPKEIQQNLNSMDIDNPSSASKGSISIVPRFRVKERQRTNQNSNSNNNSGGEKEESNSWKELEGVLESSTKSYNEYQESLVIHDLKESVGSVYPEPWNQNGAANRPPKTFEFPNGVNGLFGIERMRGMEVLFSPGLWREVEGVLPPPSLLANPTPIPALILDAISSVDVDNRAALYSNIVCVGGATMVPGFTDRLSQELVLRMPGQKIKLHAPGNTIERRYSSWLGGSILASLGTFHQLWISRSEWEEHGRNIVGVRCK